MGGGAHLGCFVSKVYSNIATKAGLSADSKYLMNDNWWVCAALSHVIFCWVLLFLSWTIVGQETISNAWQDPPEEPRQTAGCPNGKCGKMVRWDISIALPCALGKAGGELFWKKTPNSKSCQTKDVSAVQGFFSLTWKGPQSEHQEVADDCSEGVTSKRKVTHNATLAETSIATETLGSENKPPFGKTSRQCYVSFSECTVRKGF